MVRQHGVLGRAGGNEEGVGFKPSRLDAEGNRRVKPLPDTKDTALLLVVRQQRLSGPSIHRAVLRKELGYSHRRKNGVLGKEFLEYVLRHLSRNG